MSLFQKNNFKGPVFFKESLRANKELQQINDILKYTKDSQLEKKAKLISFGIEGEKNIHFELENSHIPMYVLHDVYLEDEGLSAQIDYIIMTRKKIFVIECKNLIGTITIDNNNNFTREYTLNGKKIKEGIYSPITQNNRHLELIKQMRGNEKGMLSKKIFEKYFYDNYQSLVVLANPRSILNNKYAKKDVKKQVIKADQLIHYIQETTKNNDNVYTEQDLIDLSNWFIAHHIENPITIINESPQKDYDFSDDLRQDLKKYRLKTSQENNYKPYFIFTNQQMENLIKLLPVTIDELKKINGFADIKCEKFGNDIISIIQKYKMDN